jgi:hypothetical protein
MVENTFMVYFLSARLVGTVRRSGGLHSLPTAPLVDSRSALHVCTPDGSTLSKTLSRRREELK